MLSLPLALSSRPPLLVPLSPLPVSDIGVPKKMAPPILLYQLRLVSDIGVPENFSTQILLCELLYQGIKKDLVSQFCTADFEFSYHKSGTTIFEFGSRDRSTKKLWDLDLTYHSHLVSVVDKHKIGDQLMHIMVINFCRRVLI